MSEKPILFNTEMVRAILDGRKTVTRRVLKLPNYVKESEENPGLYTLYAEGGVYENQCMEDPGFYMYLRPPYQIGDILYVRETVWQECCRTMDITGEISVVLINNFKYVADCSDKPESNVYGHTWVKRPSIHMPKEAARIWLRITDVRVERLQDMTNYVAEGIKPGKHATAHMNYYDERCDFIALWNSTIKKEDLDNYGWDANPWVWVIEFEKCNILMKLLNKGDLQWQQKIRSIIG